MSLHFVILSGPNVGRLFTLHAGADQMLGRGANCLYRLTDPRTSRVHCQILLEGDQPTVIDNDSASGTFVNGVKIKRHALKLGDVVQVGDTRLRLQIADFPLDVAMSLVEPGPKTGAAPPQDALKQLLDLSGQKIVHRNVAPKNILLQATDKVVKLGDLMRAKALEGALAQQITRTGELVGDVAYMAPERTRGQGDVDGRSDLYGLGATVYALLTARPPFDGATLVEKITRIRQTEPERPTKFQRSIPSAFEGAVLRMLAKRPEDRPQTAAELVTDLERVGKYQGVTV